MTTTYTSGQATETLTAEGHAPADVESVLDQLIDAGLDLDQPDDDTIFTAAELDLAREQLATA